MIHDIRREYFDLNLDQYQLTFDDSLFSQYYYFPLLKNNPRNLIYFITTSFIRPGKARRMFSGEYIPYLKSKKYGYRTFVEGKFDHFMTIEELQAISSQTNVRIGVHSHFHDVIFTRTHPRKRKPISKWKLERFQNLPDISGEDLSIRSKLAFQGFNYRAGLLMRRTDAEWADYIKHDTELCLRWMEDNLGIRPDFYCFPFNEHNEKLIAILKTYGFKKFFSARPGKSTEVLGRVDIDSLINPP
ncbi:MAG: polysaccharide deacetylase family protein [Deltaproteobacteria bacterium]|nr:polysaccharide deacetylase family protein [Deltaproteobacteria bacterium]